MGTVVRGPVLNSSIIGQAGTLVDKRERERKTDQGRTRRGTRGGKGRNKGGEMLGAEE